MYFIFVTLFAWYGSLQYESLKVVLYSFILLKCKNQLSRLPLVKHCGWSGEGGLINLIVVILPALRGADSQPSLSSRTILLSIVKHNSNDKIF